MFYFVDNVKKLLLKEEDTIYLAFKQDDRIDKDEFSVQYKDIDLTMFWILRTSIGVENPFWLTDQIKPFLTMSLCSKTLTGT